LIVIHELPVLSFKKGKNWKLRIVGFGDNYWVYLRKTKYETKRWDNGQTWKKWTSSSRREDWDGWVMYYAWTM